MGKNWGQVFEHIKYSPFVFDYIYSVLKIVSGNLYVMRVIK